MRSYFFIEFHISVESISSHRGGTYDFALFILFSLKSGSIIVNAAMHVFDNYGV